MSDIQTMVRTEITLNGESYLLAQGQDLDALRHAVEEAVRAGGKFVDFVVVGNRAVAVLVSSRTAVEISEQTVQFDARDTGDDEDPFGGIFDF